MVEISATVVRRPIREVFDKMADLENAAHFDPQVRSADRMTTGQIGVGTEFRFFERTPPFGRFRRTTARYTLVEAPHRIELTAFVRRRAIPATFVFDPVAQGTRVSVHGQGGSPGGLSKLLEPLVSRQVRRLWDQRLNDFRLWAEQSTPDRPQSDGLQGLRS